MRRPVAQTFLERCTGHFVYDENANALHEGEFVIQADSVFTNHEERDEHPRNDDFLGVASHATIRFRAKDWQPDEDGGGTISGELILLGETRPVSHDVTLNKSAEYPFGYGKHTLGISARTTIKRSEWGMNNALENELVSDEVELIFEFEAIRQ